MFAITIVFDDGYTQDLRVIARDVRYVHDWASQLLHVASITTELLSLEGETYATR